MDATKAHLLNMHAKINKLFSAMFGVRKKVHSLRHIHTHAVYIHIYYAMRPPYTHTCNIDTFAHAAENNQIWQRHATFSSEYFFRSFVDRCFLRPSDEL